MSTLLRNLVVVASMLLPVGLPALVSGASEIGVGATVLATGTSSEGIEVLRRGATDVTVREITIAPGGSTGWHYHDGELLSVVQSGTLTRTMHDCSTEVTSAGESFVEPAGRHHFHIGRNLGAEPVVLLVAYVLPAGRPPSHDVPDPQSCDP